MERRTVTVHGHEISYRTGGEGPVVLLIHGMAGSSSSWVPVLPDLAPYMTYVAPDLPGHGHSDKWRGDYSLGAYAGFLRDLLAALGHDRATIVGQSLGGGVAMQLAYQHPERCERLVLVCAGGLGKEVMPVLRGLAAPGVGAVLPVAFQPFYKTVGETLAGWAGKVGLQPSAAVQEMWRAYTSLIDPRTRNAFLHTLRSVVDVKGQRVSARDRLYLAQHLPTMVVWGDHDPVIPVSHAYEARDALPGSRLEIMEGCGHFPHCEDPRKFAGLLVDFISTTEPARMDHDELTKMFGSSGD